MNTNDLPDWWTDFEPTQVHSWMDRLTDILNGMAGLPSITLVLLTCLGIGWVFKSIKRFPNDAVPVVVIAWGMIFTWLTMEQMPEGYQVIAWRSRNLMIGFATGCFAWGLHYWVLYRIENIPWLKRLLSRKNGNGTTPP